MMLPGFCLIPRLKKPKPTNPSHTQRWRLRLFTLCLFLLAPSAHSQDEIQLWVTVDWEGLSLEEDNLAAMRDFRQQFPDIPFLHLINPAYFTAPHAHRAQLGSAIRSTFLASDTVGLHLHPQRNLVEACGLTYQSAPAISPAEANCQGMQCGHAVSLELAYTQPELHTLVACASALLQQNGFNPPKHFRAGAWQLGPKLQSALVANGFVWDSSRIDAQLLLSRWPAESALVRTLQQLHPGAQACEQPFALTPQLMEYPDNAALADYTSTRQLLQLFNRLLAHKQTVMVLGFHQESASDYLWRLTRAVPHLQAMAKQAQVKLVWMPQ